MVVEVVYDGVVWVLVEGFGQFQVVVVEWL